MKKKLFIVALLFLQVISFRLPAQCWKWAKVSSSAKKGVIDVTSMAIDKAGNVYEIGWTTGPDSVRSTFGPYSVIDSIIDTMGYTQGVLVSTDSNGTYRWAMGTENGDVEFEHITTDLFGNSYISGFCNTSSFTFGSLSCGGGGNTFVAKVNSSGNVLWIKILGFGNIEIMKTNTTGNLYLAGSFYGISDHIGTTTLYNSDPLGTTPDALYAKFDSSGNPIWAKSFHSSVAGREYCKAMTITDDSEIYIAGNFFSYTSSPTPTYFPDTMVIGTSTIISGAHSNSFFAKLDKDGNPLWASANANDSISITDVATDKLGNAYFCGGYNGTLFFATDTLPTTTGYYPLMFFAKYDSSGNAKWARTVNNFSLAYSISIDSSNNIWLSGQRIPPSSDVDPMYIAEFNTAGSIEDTVGLNSGGDDWSFIAVDNRGSFYLGGDYMVSPFVVGGSTFTLTDSSTELLFVLKYSYPCEKENTPVVSQSQTNDLSIYPNPATTFLTISVPDKINTITITNLLGQIVYTQLPTVNCPLLTADVANLPAGIYLIKVNGTEVRKFVKQ